MKVKHQRLSLMGYVGKIYYHLPEYGRIFPRRFGAEDPFLFRLLVTHLPNGNQCNWKRPMDASAADDDDNLANLNLCQQWPFSGDDLWAWGATLAGKSLCVVCHYLFNYCYGCWYEILLLINYETHLKSFDPVRQSWKICMVFFSNATLRFFTVPGNFFTEI